MNMNLDQKYLDEALPQLQDYLLSKELFWALNASLPRLTIGGLLLALTRSPNESYRLRIETFRIKWHSAWEEKCAREMRNRLTALSSFLAEHHASEHRVETYPQEIRWRAMLELLRDEIPNSPEAQTLAEMDRKLKTFFVSGSFVWENDLRFFFPQEKFWFLYGKIK
jgi:hypothetical protein